MTAERIKRRLAAVLAADVAGYSRLMGLDEEGTLARLKAVRKTLVDPTIAAHRGRIVKTTGDGMLVEFASAVDAARSAVEVQRGMLAQHADVSQNIRIEFRIGIHVGDIIIDENDIFGDGVNIAARLEGIAEPGGVCLSDDAYRQIRGKVEIACDDLGPQTLKNIAEPMRAWRVKLDGQGAVTAQPGSIASVAPALVLPDKPSIAVLPFQNMSGDPEQEYFADGMVEDIITALSRFKSLFVIARNSSFTYKGRPVDIKQVGRELGVRYVLEGSVRKAGGRVRITGQLIEAATGAHIWADKIDGAVEDVFDLQDKVTEKVVGAIEPSITKAEINRVLVKPTSNLDAYDLFLRALSVHYSQTQVDTCTALELLDRALEIDKTYSWARAFAAYVICLRMSQGWAAPEDREKGVRYAREALSTHDDDPQTMAYAAHATAWLAREYEIALAALDRAVNSNPHSFNILVRSGWVRAWVADFDQASDHFMRSLRLNPVDPQLGYAYGGLAFVCIMKTEYEKALEYARRTAHDMPTWTYGWSALAAAAAYSGRMEEAAQAIRHLRTLSPNFSASVYRAYGTARDRDLTEKMAQGLLLAGLPEQ